VYSLSEDKPLKTANFKLRDAGFDGAPTYSAWKFIYSPVGPGQAAATGAKPGAEQPGAAQPGAAAPASADTPVRGTH